MTGTSGAIAMATVSRAEGLPLTAVDFTDSRTRTVREGKSTHTISPTIVFEGAAGTAFFGAEDEEEDAAGFGASSGATNSARRRTRATMLDVTCTRRAGFGRGRRAHFGTKTPSFRGLGALIRRRFPAARKRARTIPSRISSKWTTSRRVRRVSSSRTFPADIAASGTSGRGGVPPLR